MTNFLDKLKSACKTLAILVNGAFLAMLPFYEQLTDSLPQLQPYLPENVYRKVGIAVVIINIVLHLRTHRPPELAESK